MNDIDPKAGAGFAGGDGELGRLVATFDWSATSLGPIVGWPAPIKAIVGMMLRSPLPIVTLWGQPGVMIYNDAYAVFAGARHPAAFGRDVRDGWPEVADFNAHVVETVFGRGETLSYVDQELTLFRNGRPEQVWMNLDYSPVLGEDGTPLGVIAIVVETTDRVLASRRVQDERVRLRQMYEQSPSFMALLDGPEHRFVLANAAYQKLVGRRDLIGRTLAEALPDAVGQGHLDLLDDVFSSGKAYTATGAKLLLKAEPGAREDVRYVDFVYQPITGPEGHVTGVFVDGVDVTDRLLAEEAINASELQFRTLAQAMPNQVWTAQPDGMLDWFNERVEIYTGIPRERLAGAGWMSIVHPDDRAAAGARWAASLASGEDYETEFRLAQADGSYRWHLARALPIRTDGRITRWIGTNTDIHDQKLAIAAAAEDRDRLWTLSQDLMLVCDFHGTITAVNPSATRLLGWEQDELVGRRLDEFIHPDDLASSAAELAKLARGARTLSFENRYRCKDGGYRLLDWNSVPDAGRVHAVGRDITEERALARDRERIWTLSPVLKLVCNFAGEVLAVNPSWEKALGWSVAETVGRPALDFMVPDGREAGAARLEQLAAGTPMMMSETVFMTRDGGRRRIAWTTVPDNGTLYSFGRDITAEAEAAEALAATEEALRQAQKMEAVGQLTGGIAHDFNNLLQGITGSLEIVQRRVAQGRTAELDRFIAGATTAANRAAALTHRLLAFSRRQPLDPRPVRANPLVASMEDLLRRTIGERIDLELVLAGDCGPPCAIPTSSRMRS